MSTQTANSGGVLMRNLIDQCEREHFCTIHYAIETHKGQKVVTEITIHPRFLPLGFKEQVMDYIREEVGECEFECTWWKNEGGLITKITI